MIEEAWFFLEVGTDPNWPPPPTLRTRGDNPIVGRPALIRVTLPPDPHHGPARRMAMIRRLE